MALFPQEQLVLRAEKMVPPADFRCCSDWGRAANSAGSHSRPSTAHRAGGGDVDDDGRSGSNRFGPGATAQGESHNWESGNNQVIGFHVSPDAEGDTGDEFAAETVVQSVEDFLAAVAHDFREPDVVVHGHEERAFV